MKMVEVEVKCTLLLDESVAEFIGTLISNNSLPSEIAYYLEQRSKGGYIVKQSDIDEIVDDIVDSDKDNVDRDIIEDAVKSALTDFLTQGSINFNNIASSSPQVTQDKKVVNKEDSEDEVATDVISFESSESDSDECMSDEEADDLADFFGF